MGRRRTTPELQKLKTFDDSPELMGTKGTSSQKMAEPAKIKNSPRIMTRARGRHATKKEDPISVPEMDDTPTAIEDQPQKEGPMSPKMFYNKRSKKSAKLVVDNDQDDVPVAKKSRRNVKENKSSKTKSGSKNCPAPNSEENNGSPVVLPKNPIPVPEIDDTPPAIEDEPQKEGVMSPKMFYNKRSKKTAISANDNQQDDVPAAKKGRRAVKGNTGSKGKLGSKNSPQPNSEDNNDSPVVLPKQSQIKTKRQSSINKKNIENKTSASSAPVEPLTALKKENRVRESRIRNKGHMTAEEVITELTNDRAPNLLPITQKVNTVKSRKVLKDVVDDVPVRKSKTVKPANSVGNKRHKVHLSLEDVVNEVSPDSPEKKPPESKDASKQKLVKKGQPKKVSDNANRCDDDWDHSLLLITDDDMNDSANIYDFEEFQIGAAKTSSASNSSSIRSDKKKSIKKAAAMKAVMSKKKVNKELSSKRKTKKSTTKSSKTTATKKVAPKKVSPTTSVNPTTSGNPMTGSSISVENPNSSIGNCGSSVSDDPFQTPRIQLMKEPVSITELEKVKFTKLIENKVITKVNPGVQEVLAPDWPQLPDLHTQRFTKLKRGAMEGPTAADNLPENKPKSVMIKTCSAFNQSSLDLSSINAGSPSEKERPVKAPSKKIDGMLTEKLATDNQPIDLFTYPTVVPMKKKGGGTKKSDKSKETPTRKLMDFMYAGSVERFWKKPKEDPAKLVSPPAVMLPKFLRAETSTPNTAASCPKSLGGESVCISPVKNFLSPTMRTYDHISRRSSASFLAIIKNGDLFTDEPKENSPQETKADKSKGKKKGLKTNKKFDEWANRMSNEFDEIEHFELSIES